MKEKIEKTAHNVCQKWGVCAMYTFLRIQIDEGTISSKEGADLANNILLQVKEENAKILYS